MGKNSIIEKNIQSFFELAQQAFSEIVMFMDMGDYFKKARFKDYDFTTNIFTVNAHNIFERFQHQNTQFDEGSEFVDRPLCDEKGRICEKIDFEETGLFYLMIKDGYCLKNIDTHSVDSFFIQYLKELNQYCFFKFSNEDHLVISADYCELKKGEKPEELLPVYDKETEENCWALFSLAMTGIGYDNIHDPKYEKELNQKLDHIVSLSKHGYKEPESFPLLASYTKNERSHFYNLISSMENLARSIYDDLSEFIGPIIQKAINIKDHAESIPDSKKKKGLKNHLKLIPKYKDGYKCKNEVHWYGAVGQYKSQHMQDDPFDLLYYICWLEKHKKEPLKFHKKVPDDHIVEIMGVKEEYGPMNRFQSKWSRNSEYRVRAQRMSDINKIFTQEFKIMIKSEYKFRINSNISIELEPFPEL